MKNTPPLDAIDSLALAATVCERVINKQVGTGSEQRASELRMALAKLISSHTQQCAVDWLAEATWQADRQTAAAQEAARQQDAAGKAAKH